MKLYVKWVQDGKLQESCVLTRPKIADLANTVLTVSELANLQTRTAVMCYSYTERNSSHALGDILVIDPCSQVVQWMYSRGSFYEPLLATTLLAAEHDVCPLTNEEYTDEDILEHMKFAKLGYYDITKATALL